MRYPTAYALLNCFVSQQLNIKVGRRTELFTLFGTDSGGRMKEHEVSYCKTFVG